ncbi:MAG: T9SS type A sorting domain-containing protein [Bacteroidota bacterium]
MKTQIFTLLMAASLFCSSQASAQITLSSSNMPTNAAYIGTNDSLRNDSSASVYPNLQPATNAMWNLSGMVYTVGSSSVYHVAVPSGSAFTSAAYYDSLGAGGFNAFYSNTATGIVNFGFHVPHQANYLGTAGDTLTTLNQDVILTAPDTVLPFPATLGRNWSNAYTTNVNATLLYLVSGFPVYNNAPTQFRSHITETDTVVGWGSMSVKVGTTGGSQYFPVLQVKRVNIQQDSIFVNGTPAPAALLTAAGVSQGQLTYTYTMDFYRANEIVPLGSFTFTNNVFDTVSAATIHYERIPLSISSIAYNDNINIYPNPLTGNTIHVAVPSAAAGTWSYELINIMGQVIANNTLTLNADQADIHLSAPLAKGIYYVRLNNNGQQVTVKALSIEN